MRHTAELLIAAFLLASVPALAQEVDEATRAAARQVGKDGLEAYKQGQYQDALEKLNRAYEVVRAPTLGLWTARAMVQVGRLVEASERYVEATRLEVTGGDTALQEEAKTVAAEEREALLRRIPQLELVVDGAPPDQVRIELDGKDVPTALLGLRRPVNPGVRKATGTFGAQVVTEEVTLAEGEAKRLVLRFGQAPEATAEPPPAATPAPAPPSPAGPAQEPAASTVSDVPPDTGSTQRTLGWVSIGVGGVGLVVGGITGALVLSKQKELESSDECVNEACGPAEYDNVDAYNSLRPISTAGFIVGGVGLAAGLTLLLATPKREESTTARVSPWVGLGSAGLAGTF